MGKTRKINIIVSTVLLALFLYLAFRNVKLNELVSVLENTNYFYVIFGMLIGTIGGTIMRCLRWRALLEPVKKDIAFRNLFSTTTIGYMMSNLIPRSGEFARPYLLGRHEGISRSAAFATIIVERILDTVMFLLMFALVLVYFRNRITDAIPSIGPAVLILSGLIFLLTLWIVFMMLKPGTSLKIIKFFTRILPKKIDSKVEEIFRSLITGFDVLKKPSLFFRISIYSVLLWLMYLASTFIPFYSFGILISNDISWYRTLWDANLLLVLVSVAMFVPVPAATGPYHYMVKLTLVNIFAVSESTALGYATATHLVGYLIFLVAGLYYFITSQYKFSELKTETNS